MRAHGFTVAEADSRREARRAWDAVRPDLVILDLGLPDRDGSRFLRAVRRDATTPILVLSARDQERDKVTALELGADDYVTKPVGLDELRARIAALLRRAAGPAAADDGMLALGPIRIDPARREVSVDGRPVDLTPREYELLKVMLAEPGRVLTRGRLLRAVWGELRRGGALPARLRRAGCAASSPPPTRRGAGGRADRRRARGRLPRSRGLTAPSHHRMLSAC